jgi:hypothetical protein
MVSRDYAYSGKKRLKFLIDSLILEDKEIEYVDTSIGETSNTLIYRVLNSTVTLQESENKNFATNISIFGNVLSEIERAKRKLEKIANLEFLEL